MHMNYSKIMPPVLLLPRKVGVMTPLAPMGAPPLAEICVYVLGSREPNSLRPKIALKLP